MKKAAKIAMIAGILIVVIISALAVIVHIRLSEIEGNEENQQETAEQKIKEIKETLTNPDAKHDESSESQEHESVESCENTNCYSATLTRVIDGDTIVVDNDDTDTIEEIHIRLALTSTPELDEEGGIEAKEFTENFCKTGSHVIIDEDDGQPQGSYGRTLGLVYCDNGLLNSVLLDEGLAYIDERFCSVSEFASDDWAIENGC